MRRRQFGWALATGTLLAVGAAAGLKLWTDERRADQTLESRVKAIQPIPQGAASCDAWLAGRMPLVLVAMGQSNAGNHGDLTPQSGRRPALPVLHQGRCVMAQEPLPGGTGSGASLWSTLHQRLNGTWANKPIVWLVIGVESTRLDDWTDARSPLRRVWEREVDAAVATGWPIAGVLWQQGEADALSGTSTEDYAQGLRDLRAMTEARGLPGPWWLARSTLCPPGARKHERDEIRAAVKDLVDEPTHGFRAGADTDTLTGSMRNGCHFSAEGVEAAAALWQKALEAKPSPDRS
ncbi:sialate O-acetylesterase [Roseateles terrae]|uniref:Sialate O-acetylesterase domain-containing protein n=1 Tax=Roseateles terrae TaxID=431060 RepID=A0ABR6GN02_9BURK|nr:sialate O-acetylesterase [Roseateles terrae]MBB3193491.1 hypothetical protein [Roseateles terrae]OWQ89334.1 hypothetical protein CDN98_01955 [Roseateles terrae]